MAAAAPAVKLLTLVVVRDRGARKVLLGEKLRGFGAGYFNGFGGKVEPGESVEEGAHRELLEEAGVTAPKGKVQHPPFSLSLSPPSLLPPAPHPRPGRAGWAFLPPRRAATSLTLAARHAGLERVGWLKFNFDDQPKQWHVHVFTTDAWAGEPAKSDEMSPVWFGEDELPFAKMWADDPLWYPLLLQGKKFVGECDFENTHDMVRHDVKVVEGLPPISPPSAP